jgi:hypothetical protein
MDCPVCQKDGADHQQVGPAVTVFCCPSCLEGVLRTFASHKGRAARADAVPAAVGRAAFG